MQLASGPHQMCPLSTISRMLASTLLRISLIIINIRLWPSSSLSPDVGMIVLLLLRQQDVSTRLHVLGRFSGGARQLGRAQRNKTWHTWIFFYETLDLNFRIFRKSTTYWTGPSHTPSSPLAPAWTEWSQERPPPCRRIGQWSRRGGLPPGGRPGTRGQWRSTP